ncbi:ubiquitin-conjugating enzyme E2-binding protein [Blastocladiella britannica]|nr:ubiquitin-conjugating enzyme E2-binding protein [Blastocladiella britannica]
MVAMVPPPITLTAGPLPFLLETCPNTRTASLTLALPPLVVTENNDSNENADSAVAAATIVAGLVVTPTEAVLANISYPFALPVDPRSLSVRAASRPFSDLSLRLLLAHPDGSARPSTLARTRAAAHGWSANDLLHLDAVSAAAQLQCATCGSAIVSSATTTPTLFTHVRALPSSAWHDLVESWACHEQKIEMPTSAHLAVASPDDAWVGPAVLVVHVSRLDSDAVRWRAIAAPHPDSIPHGLAVGSAGVDPTVPAAECAKCGTLVAAKLAPADSSAVHLLKTRLVAMVAAPSSSARRRTPVDGNATARLVPAWRPERVARVALLAELVDRAATHAAHRVRIVDMMTHRCAAELWTVNWTCMVRTRATVAERAVKVLFRVPTDSVSDNSDDKYGIGSEGLVVVPSAEWVVGLLSALGSDLPPSCRLASFQGLDWQVAYLYP